MPPSPTRCMMVYRPPVTCRSAVTDGSGGDCRRSVLLGMMIPQRTPRAASPRYQLPQSVQNISAPELHAYEVVWRPRSRDAEVEARLALCLRRHGVGERLPAVRVDEERCAGDDAIFVVTIHHGETYRRRRLAPQQSQTLGCKTGQALPGIVFLAALRRDAHTRGGMAFDHRQGLSEGEVVQLEPAHHGRLRL